jgi:hypothetical protein
MLLTTRMLRLVVMTSLLFSSRLRGRIGRDRERGDVPGWVLVTIMTAGLVTLLWTIAGDRLSSLLNEALDGVTGP